MPIESSSTTATTEPAIDMWIFSQALLSGCRTDLVELQGESSDEAFARLLEEAGLDYVQPDGNWDETSASFDGLHLCLESTRMHLTDTFGISAATWGRIEGTRALDGELTAEADNATVWWRYSPSSGLSVTIETANRS